jgi:hypothetical protein
VGNALAALAQEPINQYGLVIGWCGRNFNDLHSHVVGVTRARADVGVDAHAFDRRMRVLPE